MLSSRMSPSLLLMAKVAVLFASMSVDDPRCHCVAWNSHETAWRSPSQSSIIGRRQALREKMAWAAGTLTPLVVATPSSEAAAPLDAAEAIRRGAANIPGYGQTDVFYPSPLAGSWQMTRLVELPNGSEPIRLTYPFRFIRSIEDDAVVADRGFNQAELEKSLGQAVTMRQGDRNPDDGGSFSSVVRSYEWVQNNPNDLRVVLSDGSRKEIKVTKRATERTDSTISSSEFQRLTQEGERGIPSISARRILTKWKIVDDSTMEGLEIVYDMGGGDPLAGSSTSSSPTILSKSKLFLSR